MNCQTCFVRKVKRGTPVMIQIKCAFKENNLKNCVIMFLFKVTNKLNNQ